MGGSILPPKVNMWYIFYVPKGEREHGVYI